LRFSKDDLNKELINAIANPTKSEHVQTVQVLLNAGADPTYDRSRSLALSSGWGQNEVTKLLLEAGQIQMKVMLSQKPLNMPIQKQ